MDDRISAYAKEPTPEQVHDLRTAARRLLVVIELLPKNVRSTGRIRKYSERIQKLISLNAKVRDLDIIISRVSSRKSDPEYAKLTTKLENRRKTVLRPAFEFALSFREKNPPTIRGEGPANFRSRKRFSKLTRRLNVRISKRLATVLRDSSEKRELHILREDARMLRYMFEQAGKQKSSKILPVLTSWQEILGLIHDSDIVIDYLQNEEENPESRDLIRDELAERNKNFEIFASMASKSIPKFDQ